jgi:hypothetical protein
MLFSPWQTHPLDLVPYFMGFNRKGKAMNQDHIATPEEDEAFNMIEQQSNLGKQILRDMQGKHTFYTPAGEAMAHVYSSGPVAMDYTKESVWSKHSPSDAFEQGRQAGMAQERALWQMQAEGQKIEQTGTRKIGVTEQPKRDWVGLTDEDVKELRTDAINGCLSYHEILEAIEAKLKEKNT